MIRDESGRAHCEQQGLGCLAEQIYDGHALLETSKTADRGRMNCCRRRTAPTIAHDLLIARLRTLIRCWTMLRKHMGKLETEGTRHQTRRGTRHPPSSDSDRCWAGCSFALADLLGCAAGIMKRRGAAGFFDDNGRARGYGVSFRIA
jgi:hypothetical protein